MAEEIDDNGFYREDFSAESDWEIFNAQLCELFQKWELANNDWQRTFEKDELYKCNWNVEQELLDVKGKHVVVAYYKAQLKSKEGLKVEISSALAPMHEDLLSPANTFASPVLDDKSKDLHWLARFYGLRRFVVLNPRSEQSGYITKRSEFSFYLSAASVVAAEVCSAVPIFVQIYDQKWNFFLGLGMTSYMRTNFDLVALEKPPLEYCYLSGLLSMFKEKLPKHCKHPALVSVRNTYALDTVKMRVPMYVPFGMTPIVDEERSIISVSHFTALPHGFFPDSCTDMFAIFTWPELTDSMVIDSPLQTQFVPHKAPNGSLYQAVHANSYLSECLKNYHDLISSKNKLESYVGRNFSGASTLAEAANPLDQLTKSQVEKFHSQRSGKKIDDTAAQSQPATQKKLSGPMNEHELNQMLYYLFPDLHPEVALFPYETRDSKKIDPHRIKSAIADSLVHRLSCLLATCHAHFGGKGGLAQLWATFTRELRFLWDSCITIPGVLAGNPDTRTCLLHQKLQMLNVCMERRLQREQGFKRKRETENLTEDEEEDDDEDDNDTEEEFYDCDEDEKRSISPLKSIIATKPEGRLKRLGDLKLLDSEEYLYVPIIQEPVPKTEDELQDEADVMLKLGSGSDYVTDMMCSTLYSDTEAFKAANLQAKFEDFIRWYSPNDWEEFTDGEEGVSQHKLSARMMAEGNTWKLVWEQAKPVPIARQKRLFDDTNEGFKILNYLETRNLGEIYGLTVVPLLHSSVLKLKNIFMNSHVLDLFNESLDEILADLSRFSRDIEIVAANSSPASTSTSSSAAATSSHETNYVLQLPNPKPISKKIENLEMHFYQYKCFERMPAISEMNMTDIQEKFKEMLKNNGGCNITSKHLDLEGKATSLEERLLVNSFQTDMADKLISKDYVIRMGEGLTQTPQISSDKPENAKPIMPQFLRAIVTGEKLRLCGAFTENTTFLE